jgi:hypothetical protein
VLTTVCIASGRSWSGPFGTPGRGQGERACTAAPIDLQALKALRGSPLALDIYSWLTDRMSYLGIRA